MGEGAWCRSRHQRRQARRPVSGYGKQYFVRSLSLLACARVYAHGARANGVHLRPLAIDLAFRFRPDATASTNTRARAAFLNTRARAAADRMMAIIALARKNQRDGCDIGYRVDDIVP